MSQHSAQGNNTVKANTQNRGNITKKELKKETHTLEIFFTMGLSEVLLVQSSNGGGNTFPDRRSILVAAPVIC